MQKIRDFFKSFAWAKIFLIFFAISFVVRTVFLVEEAKEINLSAFLLLKIYFVGLFFDFLTFCYIIIFPLFYYLLVPQKVFNSKPHQIFLKVLYFAFLFVIVFSAFSEYFFFDEFQTRFNFIAVDYLIYTQEVIGNIVESYPLGILLSVIFVITFTIFYFTHKEIVAPKAKKLSLRLTKFAFISFVTASAFVIVDSSKLDRLSKNNYVVEIMENGIYQLFSAYRNNQIDYDKLYVTYGIDKSISKLRSLISKQEPGSKFLNKEDISRFVLAANPNSPEKKYNIILVSMESFSADFMAYFGNKDNIAPNLDALAKKGLFFTNLKATGTRTVRGLEALSLAIPPTPGNSIVRRPHNENLFNISSPLLERGYEAKFIYGGFGYFDNMNYFFGNNGFEVVDRESFSKDEISFSNVWGVADEDLFDKAIKEADESYAAGKPFLNFIMTTSNHRPFTYPDGKIDIASKSGRDGAVKYSDYAVGKLVEKARAKKWFDNTIFVFVADHCAGSAGNSDVPLWRYQIPAIFYAPKIIKPQIFAQNISQIDIAPTLLGFLNISYKSKFFGTDVLNNKKTIDQHAFLSTYADVGYFKNNMLYLLKPKKEVKFYDVKINHFGWNGSEEKLVENYSGEGLDEAISYYESASYLFTHDKLKNFITP